MKKKTSIRFIYLGIIALMTILLTSCVGCIFLVAYNSGQQKIRILDVSFYDLNGEEIESVETSGRRVRRLGPKYNSPAPNPILVHTAVESGTSLYVKIEFEFNNNAKFEHLGINEVHYNGGNAEVVEDEDETYLKVLIENINSENATFKFTSYGYIIKEKIYQKTYSTTGRYYHGFYFDIIGENDQTEFINNVLNPESSFTYKLKEKLTDHQLTEYGHNRYLEGTTDKGIYYYVNDDMTIYKIEVKDTSVKLLGISLSNGKTEFTNKLLEHGFIQEDLVFNKGNLRVTLNNETPTSFTVEIVIPNM